MKKKKSSKNKIQKIRQTKDFLSMVQVELRYLYVHCDAS